MRTTHAPTGSLLLATLSPVLGSAMVGDDGGCAPKTEDEVDPFDRTSWVIAVTLAVFAAFINNIGVNLQKLAWTKMQSGDIRSSIYRTYWVLGMAGIVSASIFDFVALAFGPQSVIAPIGSLTMVSNAFVAPCMHGEKLQRNVVSATLVIMVGCIMAVAAASHSNNICDIAAIFALYWTVRFAVYILIVGSVMMGLYTFIKWCERTLAEQGEASPPYQAVFQYHRISYSGLSGIFGAQSVLFARTIDLLFVASTRNSNIFLAYPETFIVLFCLIACIFFQLYWLNQGLARFESLYNVPIFTSTWIVGTVIGGGVFYGEFYNFTPLQAVLFPAGVLMCCAGVFLLANGEATHSPSSASGAQGPTASSSTDPSFQALPTSLNGSREHDDVDGEGGDDDGNGEDDVEDAIRSRDPPPLPRKPAKRSPL